MTSNPRLLILLISQWPQEFVDPLSAIADVQTEKYLQRRLVNSSVELNVATDLVEHSVGWALAESTVEPGCACALFVGDSQHIRRQ